MSEYEDQSQVCYFCNDADIGSCVNRSLYHKYNDSSNKLLHRIDEIVLTSKQRSVGARKYEEIKHLVDENEHIRKLMTSSKAYSELLDLLEYYKYRKFVPIFAKSIDNLKITEQLHVFYYDRLKVYYNQIKKKLNITVEQSQNSESSSSFITKTEISNQDSQILEQFKSKDNNQSFKYYETESKALENLVNLLKKQQDRMKKIKSLRTQDCTKQVNPFKDIIHKKSKLAQYFASQNKPIMAMKKNKKMFFRNIEQAKTQKVIQQTYKNKAIKKLLGQQQSRASLYYQSIKIRANSQSVGKIKKQNSKTNIANNQRVIFKNKPILQKSQHRKSCQNLMERQVIKSLPKVHMQFNIRPSRSVSSASIAYPSKQTQVHRLSSKLIVVKKETYQTQKDLENGKNIHLLNTQTKKKSETIKTPYKQTVQIDQNDNIASINRKKIEQLKMKSQRKKQSKR